MKGADVFDPELLTTFLAVADTRSFTRAAERVGLSQPTVSQQVRRLEKAAGRTLIARDTRAVTLTDNGDAMVGFARAILSAHASADAYFRGSASPGRLRFGAADDLAATQVPDVLRTFRRQHPNLTLELTVNQSQVLYRRLKAGHLDLIFIKHFPEEPDPLIPETGTSVQSDRLAWVAHPDAHWEEAAPVPLVVYAAPSYTRKLAIGALERAARPWRVACTAREVNGIVAALRAGLGVGLYPQSLIPDDLVRVDKRFELPQVGQVNYTLLSNPLAPVHAVEALTNAITDRAIRRVE